RSGIAADRGRRVHGEPPAAALAERAPGSGDHRLNCRNRDPDACTHTPRGGDDRGIPRAPDHMSATCDFERTVTIANRHGLHARPAAEFVKLAGTFSSDVMVGRDDLEVN